MKLTVILLSISLVQVSATAYSQVTKFNLQIDNKKIIDVLHEIEETSEFRFFYIREQVDVEQRISVDLNNARVEEILAEIFKDQNIKYEVREDFLILLRPNYGSFKDNKINNQEIVVKGKVTDTEAMPLPGVNVVEKGTTNGAVTDLDGNYTITVSSKDAILRFSFVGYLTEEVELLGQITIDVTLVEDILALDEVVVVGYGTMRKSDLTGAIGSADIKSFNESPNVNIAQSLHGTVPGLYIGQVNEAGATPTISIRGASTISGNDDVLIVVDNIVYTGSLNDFNPNDIASVDILKDPSSKAIYGAQAANGVILITTKEGKKSDKPIFNYKGSYTTQNPSNTMSLMNREQFIKKSYDANWTDAYLAPDYTQINPDWSYSDNLEPLLREGYENGTDYDWWDNVTDPGYINDHNLSVSGSTDKLVYYISGGYVNQKGFILNDKYERISARINLENKILKWFSVGAQTFGSFSDYSGNSPDLYAIFRTSPLVKSTDENGDYVINPDGTLIVNPFLVAEADDFDKRNSLFGNFYADIDIPFVEGLNYRLNFGNNYSWDRHYSSSPYDNGITGGAYKNNVNSYDWTLDHILSYKKTWADAHRFDLTLVAGQRERQYERTTANGTGYTNLRLSYNDLSLANVMRIGSNAWNESFLYQMARVNYGFKNKYLLTATIRRDGFSGFAKNNKIALFPSAGLGWVVSRENFVDIGWLNNLKLRASYGVNGNLADRYSSLARLSAGPAYIFGDGGSTEFGQSVTSLANPNLTWETTLGSNFGLDFSVLQNRFNGSVDYYRTTTEDLIFRVSLPQITGFSEITSNLGEIANRGIEVDLNSAIIQKGDFTWNMNFNISSNKNEIVSLIGLDADGDGQEDDLVADKLFIGESLGAIYSYESAGIIQMGEEEPEGFFVGTHRIVDQPETSEGITPDDRVIIGREEPAYRFGILNEFIYKGFTLRFFINSVQGGKNGYLARNSAPTGGTIIPSNINVSNLWNEYDYWTPSNPNAQYGRLDQIAATEYVHYADRSFVRLQDITLSYQLNSAIVQKLGIQNLKVFVTGKNLYTWTEWVGWDPETASGVGVPGTITVETRRGREIRESGEPTDISTGTLRNRPVMRGISVGLDISF